MTRNAIGRFVSGYVTRGTPSNSNARAWMGVGIVTMTNSGAFSPVPRGDIFGCTRFFTIVDKSFSRVWKLWAGSPSAVRFVLALPSADGLRLAGETTEFRSASATSCSSSSNGSSRIHFQCSTFTSP